MVKEKRDILVITLILVIVVLLGFLGYMFVVAPAINAKVVDWANQGYNKGVQDAVVAIAQKATTCQQVPLSIGNQTLNIVAVDCLKQPAQ
jgi:hypothetical protein